MAVWFHQPYAHTPVVNITAQDTFVNHMVSELTEYGFKIKTQQSVPVDTVFNWVAIAVNGANIPSMSSASSNESEIVDMPEEEPTEEESQEISHQEPETQEEEE